LTNREKWKIVIKFWGECKWNLLKVRKRKYKGACGGRSQKLRECVYVL
jgi:hypothetical protein